MNLVAGGRKLSGRLRSDELAALLDQHQRALSMYARQWTNDPDDCVQEAFVRLAAVARPDNPAAWLFQVVRRRAINASRSQRRRSERESSVARSVDENSTPEFTLQQEEEFQSLQKSLQLLSTSQRELIVLRIWSELTWAQISEITQTPLSSAHREFNEAIERLRAIMEIKLVD